MSTPTVLVVGAGAIGAFYGSRLAQVAEVSCICRSNYTAVSANGFKMKTHSFGDYDFRPAHTFSSPAHCQKSGIRWDYIIITTKALPDINDDTGLIRDLVAPSHTAIVLIQNGVGVEEPYRHAFPSNPILSAVTVASAVQTQPGFVTQNRWTRISIGPYTGEGSSVDTTRATALTETFTHLLQTSGIRDAECHDAADLQLIRWHKLAINAAMNPSSVLAHGPTNQQMTLDPDLRRHLTGVMSEIFTTAPQILGRPFPSNLASAEQILKSTERNSSGSKPSMWGDWEAGRPMELEVILGNPVRIARAKGVEMPRCEAMYALLKMAQEKRDEERQKKEKGEGRSKI